MSKNIVRVIKHVNSQLFGAYPTRVIWKNWKSTTEIYTNEFDVLCIKRCISRATCQEEKILGMTFPYNFVKVDTSANAWGRAIWLNRQSGYRKIDTYLLNLVSHDVWRQIATPFSSNKRYKQRRGSSYSNHSENNFKAPPTLWL